MASSPDISMAELWQRPPFETLRACLESLEIKPPVWNAKSRRNETVELETTLHERREVSQFLSSIVGSGLPWIEDYDEKEVLWELASRRMSERSGRSGMGEMVRRWPFEIESSGCSFELTIKEPALTGDDALGFKTWGSSYLLAQQLHGLASTSLFQLFDESLGESRPRVLELGSGTGLLGLAAAAIWQAHVVLSDLPNIVPNLTANAESNAKLLECRAASVDVGTLTWGGSPDEIDQDLFGTPHQFKIILVADPLYDDNHPELLHSAITSQLALSSDSRAVIMVPERDETTVRLLNSFVSLMTQGEMPLECLEQGELGEQDDWETDHDEVKCWWGIFGRRQS